MIAKCPEKLAHEPLAAASGPAPEVQALQQQLAASQAQLEAAAAELAAVRAQLAASRAWVATRWEQRRGSGSRPCVLGVFDSPFLARLAVRKNFAERVAVAGADGLDWASCLDVDKGGHWTLSPKAVKGLSPAAVAAIGVEVGADADDALGFAAEELQQATQDDIMEAFQRGEDVERFFNFESEACLDTNPVFNYVNAHWHPNGDGALEWYEECSEEGGGRHCWSVAHCAINAPPPKEPSWRPNQFGGDTSRYCRSCVTAVHKKGKEEEKEEEDEEEE